MKTIAKDVAGGASRLYRSLEISGSYEGWPFSGYGKLRNRRLGF